VDTDRPEDYDGMAGDATGSPAPDATGSPAPDATGVAYAADPVAAPQSRLVLGTLAGLGVVILAIAAWVVLYLAMDKDYPGITVVAALAIGYVVREVSRRSDLRARLIAAVLALVLCVVGAVAAIAALIVNETPGGEEAGFLDSFTKLLPHSFQVINDRYQPRPWLTWLIFGAAVVVAFFSAAPAKAKQAKAAPAPAEPVSGDEG
jgi:hypothetical protein